jgi:hypothetical protein
VTTGAILLLEPSGSIDSVRWQVPNDTSQDSTKDLLTTLLQIAIYGLAICKVRWG